MISGQTVISDLDTVLKQLFHLEFGTTLPFDLSLSIPDKNFTTVSQTRPTLNCYLYEITEDRELRSIEPVWHRKSDGTIEKVVPPVRIKLSYCITAWSPAHVTPGAEPPQQDEHSLLSQVLEVLLKYPTLPPQALMGTPLADQDPPPPATVILPDTSKATSDFWSAIGGQLRPSLDYKVSIALTYQAPFTERMVTTMKTSFKDKEFGVEETFYTIGGTVRDSKTPPNPIASASVQVKETGQIKVTDAAGSFVIDRLAGGTYTLTAGATGFKEGSRTINVPPQPADGPLYDIVLAPQ